MTQLAVCLRAPALWNTCVCTWCSKAVINNVMHTWVCCVRCRAAGQLAAGIIKAAQNDAAGKLLLTRALKTAHGSMGSHQLVAQVPAAASTAARLCTSATSRWNACTSASCVSMLPRAFTFSDSRGSP